MTVADALPAPRLGVSRCLIVLTVIQCLTALDVHTAYRGLAALPDFLNPLVGVYIDYILSQGPVWLLTGAIPVAVFALRRAENLRVKTMTWLLLIVVVLATAAMFVPSG